jgi:hypothetical protein
MGEDKRELQVLVIDYNHRRMPKPLSKAIVQNNPQIKFVIEQKK